MSKVFDPFNRPPFNCSAPIPELSKDQTIEAGQQEVGLKELAAAAKKALSEFGIGCNSQLGSIENGRLLSEIGKTLGEIALAHNSHITYEPQAQIPVKARKQRGTSYINHFAGVSNL